MVPLKKFTYQYNLCIEVIFMKKKILCVFILFSSVYAYPSSLLKEKISFDEKKRVELNLVAATLCYNSEMKKFWMYAFMGKNRNRESYNSCAVMKYELKCLGRVSKLKPIHYEGREFCDKSRNIEIVTGKIIYKTLEDKLACKKKYEELGKRNECLFYKEADYFREFKRKK